MKKKMIIILLALLLFVAVFVLSINTYVISSAKDRIITPEEASELTEIDAVLVLGCLVKSDGTPSAMLSDRLDTALSLSINAPFIMSGDHGTKEYDEVNVMRNYAVENGADKTRVFMDHAGFCTYDSIYRAKEIFGAKNIVIITQKYHLYRALYIAKSLGINAVGVSADVRLYSRQSVRELREILARNKDFFTSLFKVKPKYLGEKISLSSDASVTEG
jgi:vancomycin permeability regulator SanA